MGKKDKVTDGLRVALYKQQIKTDKVRLELASLIATNAIENINAKALSKELIEQRDAYYLANKELSKQLESAKADLEMEKISRSYWFERHIDSVRPPCSITKVMEAKYTVEPINWASWFWFIAGVVLTNIVYFAINNTLV